MLQPEWVIAMAPVGGPPRWLHVGGAPRFRTHGPQECCRMECPRAHFHIVRLQNNASLVGPVLLQPKNQVLKRARRRRNVRHGDVLRRGKVREYSDGPEQSAFSFPSEPRALNWPTIFQSHGKSQKNLARNNAVHQIRALISANCSIMMHEALKGLLSA